MNAVEDAIDSHADPPLVSLGLEVDVAGALLEGVVQQVPDRANNRLVVGVEVTAAFLQLIQLLEVPEVREVRGEVLLCGAHGASKTMKLDDDAEDLRLRRDDDDDLLVLDPRNALHEFVVPRVRHRNGQRRIRIVDGHDQVPLGKGSAESARDELVVELKRVEMHKWQLQGRRDHLGHRLLVQALGRVVFAIEAEGRDELNGRHPIGHPMSAQHPPHLRTLIQQDVASLIPTTVEHILLLSRVNHPLVDQQVQNPNQSFSINHPAQDTEREPQAHLRKDEGSPKERGPGDGVHPAPAWPEGLYLTLLQHSVRGRCQRSLHPLSTERLHLPLRRKLRAPAPH